MSKQKKRKTRISIKPPTKKCEDNNCPFHGSLKVRGMIFLGEIVSKDTHKTATVAWERKYYIPKYERYMKKRSKIHVHNPLCINGKEGDIVKIIECRPLSKTKKFVIVEKLGKDIFFEQKEEAMEEAKVKEKEEKKEEKPKEKEEKKEEVKGKE